MKEFEKLTQFLRLTHQFQNVKRTNRAADAERRENDAEHSFQTALIAWFLADMLQLPLDRERLIKYALVHDLAEVYAGDVDPHYSSDDQKRDKSKHEHDALLRLEHEFPEFPQLHEAQRKYHQREDPEAEFVYALDKLLCFLNIYMTNDPYYAVLQHTRAISMLDDVRSTHHKVEGCEAILELYEHFQRVLEDGVRDQPQKAT